MKPNPNPMMMTLMDEQLAARSAEEPLAAFFRYRHLPADQAELAFPFAELAMLLIDTPKIHAERLKASLDALLEARLAIVPEAIEADEPADETEAPPKRKRTTKPKG
jgi:hypothetical protein